MAEPNEQKLTPQDVLAQSAIQLAQQAANGNESASRALELTILASILLIRQNNQEKSKAKPQI